MNHRIVLHVVLLFVALTPPCRAQDGAARKTRVAATERMVDSRGDAALRDYAREHLSRAYRESFTDEAALLAHLRELRDRVAPVGGVGLEIDAAGVVRLHISNSRVESVIRLALEATPPHRVVALELEKSAAAEAGPKVTWDTLVPTLERAERDGFCGSVLAVRGGEVVLDRGFGHADPDRRHRVTPDTLFAVGSTPIDFTHAAILLLEQRGELSLRDPLAKYFAGAPADKRDITLEQLRTGASGLLDFPGIQGVDANLDLTWISRDEFVRRVMTSELRFEPGTDRRHSHCAWGMLAAVVEIVSGLGYEALLAQHFFGPAGMTRTGHYPLAKKFDASEVAVGLGGNVWGDVNSPAHWGETSWLVLGSGGMVSTTRDLHRWFVFLQGGEVLGEAARKKYGLGQPMFGVGGNDRGFVTTIGRRGDDIAIVCSNSHTRMRDESAKLAEAVAAVAARGR